MPPAPPSPHPIEPDGFCPTCRTVGCLQPTNRPDRAQATSGQLDRMEALLRRIARRVGVDVDGGES